MSKPWQQSNARRAETRPLRRYLIVCEDSKSSADYLRAFRIPPDVAEVQTIGGQGNTDSLVERARELQEKATLLKQPYIHVWCVFDRDEHPPKRFCRAIDLCRSRRDMTAIWSNECFELWYLLHFCYRDTAIGRHELVTELGRPDRLGKKYDKADTGLYSALEAQMPTALRNATRLLASYGSELKPATANPATMVHILVRQLLEIRGAVSE